MKRHGGAAPKILENMMVLENSSAVGWVMTIPQVANPSLKFLVQGEFPRVSLTTHRVSLGAVSERTEVLETEFVKEFGEADALAFDRSIATNLPNAMAVQTLTYDEEDVNEPSMNIVALTSTSEDAEVLFSVLNIFSDFDGISIHAKIAAMLTCVYIRSSILLARRREEREQRIPLLRSDKRGRATLTSHCFEPRTKNGSPSDCRGGVRHFKTYHRCQGRERSDLSIQNDVVFLEHQE